MNQCNNILYQAYATTCYYDAERSSSQLPIEVILSCSQLPSYVSGTLQPVHAHQRSLPRTTCTVVIKYMCRIHSVTRGARNTCFCFDLLRRLKLFNFVQHVASCMIWALVYMVYCFSYFDCLDSGYWLIIVFKVMKVIRMFVILHEQFIYRVVFV